MNTNLNAEKILEYLQNHNSISNSEAQNILNMSPAGVRKIFVKLVEQGILIPSGANKNRIYRLSQESKK
ncbi:MAG: winged helix-turn-helix transcriptional regulator [Treponema sp.]|jgi:DNA-binding Lrp family transcriptional regulator|nr:winged helix-turn-helix transcriptional regulator [Treponema sp.]